MLGTAGSIIDRSWLLRVPLGSPCTSAESASLLSLLSVYEASLLHDPKLAFARAQYRACQELPQARARLLPPLSLKESGNRTFELITGLSDQVSAHHQEYDQIQYGARLSQPLIRPAVWFGLSQAKAAQIGSRDGARNIVDVIQAQRSWFKACQSMS